MRWLYKQGGCKVHVGGTVFNESDFEIKTLLQIKSIPTGNMVLKQQHKTTWNRDK